MARIEAHGPGILVYRTDYKGRRYAGPFYVARHHGVAPGWFVWGVSMDEYATAGGIHHVYARPDVAFRRRPSWNVATRDGWKLRRDAQRVANHLNACMGKS